MGLGNRVEQSDRAANPQNPSPSAVERSGPEDQHDQRPKSTLIRTAARGYRCGSSAERAGFGILTAFALTVTGSRLVNYVVERRRALPRLRSWGRHAYHLPGRERLRVHHFVPGVGLAFLSGAAAIIRRDDGRELWFSAPFGAGVGLAFDEIAVMTELDNPYWESEKLAIIQAGIAGLGGLALGVRLYARGAAAEQRVPSS